MKLLQKTHQKGAVMVEYALILAFVVAVAAVSLQSDGLGKAIDATFVKVVRVMNEVSGKTSGIASNGSTLRGDASNVSEIANKVWFFENNPSAEFSANDVTSWIYNEQDGGYIVTWTTDDLSTAREGDIVRVMQLNNGIDYSSGYAVIDANGQIALYNNDKIDSYTGSANGGTRGNWETAAANYKTLEKTITSTDSKYSTDNIKYGK